MKTILHTYNFDVSVPADKAAYGTLCAELKARGLKCFESWGSAERGGHYFGVKDIAGEIELETKHLFDNQWNTPTHRVFDWAQDYPTNFSKTIKRGHYLDQTAEMRETRRNTVKCRYCGKQEPAAKGYIFCPHCLDSEYLTVRDLCLTRMKAIDDNTDCAPLTEAESAHLLPILREAQLHGSSERGKARIAEERASLEAKYRKATHAAQSEHDGMLWLMDHGLRTGNVIYYSHTDKFCFGWRKPLGAEEESDWLAQLADFPFEWEIERGN